MLLTGGSKAIGYSNITATGQTVKDACLLYSALVELSSVFCHSQRPHRAWIGIGCVVLCSVSLQFQIVPIVTVRNGEEY